MRSLIAAGRASIAARLGACLAVCLAGASFGGCATGRLVESAESVGDDGERNVVLLSYDVTLDTFDREPGVEGVHLRLRCAADRALFDSPVCFGIDVPYVGQQEREGTLWHAFASEGAGLYRMEYGDYLLDSASFSVLIDRDPETRCYETRKGRTQCYSITRDEQERVAEVLPESVAFEVAPGPGCYFGHLTLRVAGGRVVDYRLERTLDEAAFERLPPSLAAPAREHVRRACTGGAPG